MSQNKSSQFPKGSKSQPSQSLAPKPAIPQSSSSNAPQPPKTASSSEYQPVQPEQMSLEAHQHIQDYLSNRKTLDKDEVTAILRLSQHLRVFGLLSAVGYLNHGKDSGKVAQQTKPVWNALLRGLINKDNSDADLMKTMKQMAEEQPAVYMATWRKSLIWSQHWNFWAKAYQEE